MGQDFEQEEDYAYFGKTDIQLVEEFGYTDKQLDYFCLNDFKRYKEIVERSKAQVLTVPPHIMDAEKEKECKIMMKIFNDDRDVIRCSHDFDIIDDSCEECKSARPFT